MIIIRKTEKSKIYSVNRIYKALKWLTTLTIDIVKFSGKPVNSSGQKK